jgi:hypothetical protein
MTTMQQVAQAMLDSDIDQGHAASDTQWGRYEMLARAGGSSSEETLGRYALRSGDRFNLGMEIVGGSIRRVQRRI